MTTFDASRDNLSSTDMFEPFHVESTQPLQQALDRGDVDADTPVLVVQHAGGTLALLTQQMTYHHVAQGEIAGEP